MKQLFNNDWFFHREPLETTIDTFFNAKDADRRLHRNC